MTARELVLGRSSLALVAGLKIGIVVMKHDPADPAARLSIGEKGGTAHTVVTVREGDRFEFAGRRIEVKAVTPGYRPVGKVVLTVADPDNRPAPRPENLLLSQPACRRRGRAPSAAPSPRGRRSRASPKGYLIGRQGLGDRRRLRFAVWVAFQSGQDPENEQYLHQRHETALAA
jgi:hypothetical protein